MPPIKRGPNVISTIYWGINASADKVGLLRPNFRFCLKNTKNPQRPQILYNKYCFKDALSI